MPKDLKTASPFRKAAELIFYGNYFYGLCIIALMAEASLQLGLPYSGLLLYTIAFVATVLFYNYPYARNYTNPGTNLRSGWYLRHRPLVQGTQRVLIVLLAGLGLAFAARHRDALLRMDVLSVLLWTVFPVAGALYYGSNFLARRYHLRQQGWLKPFVIGFVWAGMANIYPQLYHNLLHGLPFQLSLYGFLLFCKNLMFVALLAIMFDIKDYAADTRSRLNTLVVRLGLRRTIFYLLLPLTGLGFLTFLTYAIPQHFEWPRMLLISIPFFLLLAAAISFRRRRGLMYYLVVIDGLMIVKAACGMLSVIAVRH